MFLTTLKESSILLYLPFIVSEMNNGVSAAAGVAAHRMKNCYAKDISVNAVNAVVYTTLSLFRLLPRSRPWS
jgi:hypothetical protein